MRALASLPRRLACGWRHSPSRDWKRTEFWLDTSGLALYFMQHIHTHDLSDAIDKSVLTRLRAKQEDNRLRSEDMMREFAALNRAFLDAGVRFANLKGFTLSPHSCPDPALRHQSDHDFLVDHADVAKARALLEERGFMLSGSNRHTLEFKMTSDQPGSLDRQYEARQPRSAELHIATESLDFVPAPATTRRVSWSRYSLAFDCRHVPGSLACGSTYRSGTPSAWALAQ